MHILRLLKRFVLMNALEESGGGGGGSPAAEAVVDAGTAPASVDAGAAPAAPAEAPKSMHDAIFGDKAEPLPGQPRDEAGRFAAKQAKDAADAAAAGKPAPVVPAVPGAKPAAEAPKAGEEDLALPEGLAPKAQQRFQALANEVKELRPLRERADLAERQVSYVKEAFHAHGVKPEQFEQATAVIGMINRGDFDGAQRVLTEQLRNIALITGKQAPAVDALEGFPDLRAAVDNMQVTEQVALEVARSRQQQQAVQQHQQRQQVEQQTQQQEQQAAQSGMVAVDKFCKQMQATDLDYGVIEAQLLPEIPNLIAGVPPAQWPALIQTQYRMIKAAATRFRQSGGGGGGAAAGNVLRATGAGSPSTAPKSMQEAMWGKTLGA